MKRIGVNPLVESIAKLERRIDLARQEKAAAQRHLYNCSNDLAALEQERQTALRQLQAAAPTENEDEE